jgi:beta-aspartyl-peptidase (threonine type)
LVKTAGANKAVLVVHGGAGAPIAEVGDYPKEVYTESLKAALLAGYALLKCGQASLDAVEAAIKVLEDAPCFTAGRGAVLNHAGICELDASIMDGKSGKAGAVACITVAKNPIAAARAVMEQTAYVMIAGKETDNFAREMQLEIVSSDYFVTDVQWRKYQEALKAEEKSSKLGTVGAVAIDQDGNLAAGTSTGGLRNKRYGRVGDSPIIGAGTYASNETCAVSGTGQGEMFIRQVVAYDIAALMQYKGLSAEEASLEVIDKKLTSVGGQGGVIVLDKSGNFAMRYNTEGMFRGYVTKDGHLETRIFE